MGLKIRDYKIVHGTADLLQHTVMKEVAKGGWQPWQTPFAMGDTICQAMVKYKAEDTTKAPGIDDDVIVELTSTDPHGEHRVLLVSDTDEPGLRIYRLRDSQMNGMSFTGEELMDLTKWFVKEQGRKRGTYR